MSETGEHISKGGLVDRAVSWTGRSGIAKDKEEVALEQMLKFNAARKVLKPFEQAYHEQVLQLPKLAEEGIAKKDRSNKYSLFVQTESGDKYAAIIGTNDRGTAMTSLQFAANHVSFDNNGRITDIFLSPSSSILIRRTRLLPGVLDFRKKVVGDPENPKLVYKDYEHDVLHFIVRSPTEMGLKMYRYGGDEYKEGREFSVQADGILYIEKMKARGYEVKAVVDGLKFPDLLQGALEAIDPANN